MMIDKHALLEAALTARQNAYAPYSRFAVGAALLSEDGRVFTGCNVENRSYSLTCCAERGAVMQAVAAGCRRFTAVAVVGAPQGEIPTAPCYPCGACREVLVEFCTPDTAVYLTGETATLGELLPKTFILEGTPVCE